eukprot:TRINITY_DN4055_c0_g1_i1.p1 TRINITY_DN4055_c0_g1~~TRINITY_DN4055_c0_g1_i1.p1  ORF type:complete len:398 (+),score=149.06 TRINITY_DN4055_c0_g1_i1:51-1244(+)
MADEYDYEEESEEDFPPAVIIDNGTGALKCGMAGSSKPESIIPNLVGRPHKKRGLLKKKKDIDMDTPDVLLGADALAHTGNIAITQPMADGIVHSWADMQSLWELAFEELDADPMDQPVLLTEAPCNPKKTRHQIVEIMFEQFDVPALQLKMQAICSLYASGRTTGLVLDSGDGVSHTVPVQDGWVIENAIQRSNIAGREVTDMLQRVLFQKGYNFSSHREMQYVKDIKEAGCYVAENFKDELEACEKNPSEFEYKYTLPDGQRVTFTDERFKAPEVLFQPMRIDSEELSWQGLTWASIQACGIDSRPMMFENILLSGGNTLFKNIGGRLKSEIQDIATAKNRSAVIKVWEDSGRAEAVFAGASVLASLPSFNKDWLKRDTFDEEGVERAVELWCVS